MRPGARTTLRWAVRCIGLVAAVVLVARFGVGTLTAGLAGLSPVAIAAALGLTAVATVAASWRWVVVAREFGSPVPLRSAIPAYYRSQLVNTVLPGGVLGDVERGLGADERRDARIRRLRSVAWDRALGQLTQLALVLVATLLFVPSLRVLAAALLGAGVVLAAIALRPRPACRPRTRIGRMLHAARADAHRLLRRAAVLAATLASSAVVVLAHATVFVVAAAATGAPVDVARLLPIALVVQAATVLPLGFGGVGVREGAAAAVFAAAGLGASAGVTAGIASGALSFLAVLPGVVPMVLDPLRRAVAWRARRVHRMREAVAR